ncbi:hypothetical protein C8Q76DRAFT_802418 [Earliella scabrosa]|nr:hypothetical protein C8Q76DRAFT_802418 [Earliella scabrosa]
MGICSSRAGFGVTEDRGRRIYEAGLASLAVSHLPSAVLDGRWCAGWTDIEFRTNGFHWMDYPVRVRDSETQVPAYATRPADVRHAMTLSDVDTSELDPCLEDTFPLLERRSISRERARLFLPIRAEPADLFSLENQLVADEVNVPTGSDSSSLAEDVNGAGPKAITMNVDLSEEVVNVASAALEEYNIEKNVAAQMRTEFEKRHGPT